MSVAPNSRVRFAWLAAFLLVSLVGIAVRVSPSAGFRAIGFDEGLYAEYVDALSHYGITSYPDIAQRYVITQQHLPGAVLPPTRFLYIFAGYAWHKTTGADALHALHHVSTLFAVLLMFAAALFALRLGGPRTGLGVLALMACAPTQIHMAQHALIDGFFAFWATLCLWLLWENLRQPGQWRLLLAYGVALALLVLTKENAAFVYLGLLAVIGTNRFAQFGTATPALLLMTVAGPLAGLVVLVVLAGDLPTLIAIYRLLVAKASVLPYAIKTGDGPWYRYLVDLLVINPLLLLLAIGAIFRLREPAKASLYLLVFVAASYVLMCNVRYGMNLRYANIWDMPLCYLAFSCVDDISQSLRRSRHAATVVVIAVVCLLELRQYYTFFVQHDLYELITAALLRAVQILK